MLRSALPAVTGRSQTGDKTKFSEFRFLLAPSPGFYTAVVLAVLLAALAYGLRRHGILSCQASGYDSNRFLAYCNATGYNDYDHGAFWFGLEPAASKAVSDADVLFLGNSRIQLALSTDATSEFFSALSASYYLLGFSYHGNHAFEGPLLRRLGTTAKVFVINLDLFFEPAASPFAQAVMHDAASLNDHRQKRSMQYFHKYTCSRLPALCGNSLAFFRARSNGSWTSTGTPPGHTPVSYDQRIDPDVLKAYTTVGDEFLSSLPVKRTCVLATMVPTVNSGDPRESTSLGTVKAVAAALGVQLIAPEPANLYTFDASHLDRESATRWSQDFLQAARPSIRTCLDNSSQSVARIGVTAKSVR